MGPAVTSWWRRNAVALVALAVLVPATAVVTGFQEWNEYYGESPTRAVEVSPGETAALGVARWGNASLTTVPANDPRAEDLPDATRLVVARIVVDWDDEPPGCAAPILREATGDQREWSGAQNHLPSWEPTADRGTFCSGEATQDYTLEVPFVVPESASGPFTIDLQVIGAEPDFLRFALR